MEAMHKKVCANQPIFNIGPGDADAKKTVDTFKVLFTKVQMAKPYMEGIARLSSIVTPILAAAGSETEWTASFPRAAVLKMWLEADEVINAPHLPHLRSMFAAFQSSLLARLMPLSLEHLRKPWHAGVALQKPPPLPPAATPKEREQHARVELALYRRCALDDQNNAAAFLDPASAFYANSGSTDHALAFLYQKVLVPGGKIQAGGALRQEEAKDAKEHKDRLAEIAARPKPPLLMTMSDIAWQDQLKQLADEEKKQWAAKRRRGLPPGLKLPGHDAVNPLGSGRDDDPMLPVLVSLYAEAKTLITIHQEELARLSVAAPAPGPYGDVFSIGNLARYEFWPARSSSLPLLAFCARQLLAGVKISSTSNERMHSPAEKILTAIRGCLKPAKVEQLTLGYFFVRKQVAERVKQWEVETAHLNEANKEKALEDLVERLEVEMREARAAGDAEEAALGDDEVEEMQDGAGLGGDGDGGGGGGAAAAAAAAGGHGVFELDG